MTSFCLEGKSIFDLRITIFEFLSFLVKVEEALINLYLKLTYLVSLLWQIIYETVSISNIFISNFIM